MLHEQLLKYEDPWYHVLGDLVRVSCFSEF